MKDDEYDNFDTGAMRTDEDVDMEILEDEDNWGSFLDDNEEYSGEDDGCVYEDDDEYPF